MPFPAVIDSSILVTGKSCRQKLFRQYIQGLASEETSVDLHFGGALAQGVQVAREKFFVEKKDAPTSVAAGLNAALGYWGDYQGPPEHAKTSSSLLLSMDGYFQQWPLGIDPLTPAFAGKGIEFTFAIPLPLTHPDTGDPVMYAGRFDMIGLIEGQYYICDEKTTGRGFGFNWSEGWALRSQFIGYVWAAKQYGYDVRNVLIRGISIQKTKIDFTQAIVSVPEYLVNRWHAQMLRDVADFIKCYKEGYFDFNFGDTCTSYGNCMFIPLCRAAQPEQWTNMYKTRFWNPLLKDPSSKEAKGTTVPSAAE